METKELDTSLEIAIKRLWSQRQLIMFYTFRALLWCLLWGAAHLEHFYGVKVPIRRCAKANTSNRVHSKDLEAGRVPTSSLHNITTSSLHSSTTTHFIVDTSCHDIQSNIKRQLASRNVNLLNYQHHTKASSWRPTPSPALHQLKSAIARTTPRRWWWSLRHVLQLTWLISEHRHERQVTNYNYTKTRLLQKH